jgi:hypothetical protein
MLDRLFHRTACPLSAPGTRRACARRRHLFTVIGLLVPTIAIVVGVLVGLRR